MQRQLLALLILASSPIPLRADDPPRPVRPRVPFPTTIQFRTLGETHKLTLEIPQPPDTDDLADGEGDEPPPPQAFMRIDFNTARLESDNFDRWLFPRENSANARFQHLKEVLDARIAVVAQANKLTDHERAKLRLAGRGDIKRFFDEVQKRKNQFERDRKSFQIGLATLRRLDELVPTYQDGPFGHDSLFVKTLHKIRNDRKN